MVRSGALQDNAFVAFPGKPHLGYFRGCLSRIIRLSNPAAKYLCGKQELDVKVMIPTPTSLFFYLFIFILFILEKSFYP